MSDCIAPVRGGMGIVKDVPVFRALVKPRALKTDGLVAEIACRRVNRYGVERRQHADVGEDWRVILTVTIAVRGDVTEETDMEVGAIRQDGGAVFRGLFVQDLRRLFPIRGKCATGAGAHATATSNAFRLVHGHLVVFENERTMRTVLGTDSTANALVGSDIGLAIAMHVHLAGLGATTHADVLDGSANAHAFMPLEVREADEYIRIHDGTADFRGLAVDAVGDSDFHFIGASEAIADDDLASRGQGGIAIGSGGLQVVDGVFATSGIEGAAVGQEGLAASLTDVLRNGTGILRTKIRQISGFAEVQFDGHIFVLQIQFLKTGAFHEQAEFLGQAATIGFGPKISEVDFGFVHSGVVA